MNKIKNILLKAILPEPNGVMYGPPEWYEDDEARASRRITYREVTEKVEKPEDENIEESKDTDNDRI